MYIFIDHLPFMNRFIKDTPITAVLLLINVIMFILIRAGLLSAPMFLTTPGGLTIGSFLAHFAHMDFIHILMNMAVLYQISPLIERALTRVEYIAILLSIWLGLVFIAEPFITGPSLGFSGILMGLIVVTIGLYYNYPALRKMLITWTVVNIAIGLLPGISFLMHSLGAVVGGMVILLYLFTQQKR